MSDQRGSPVLLLLAIFGTVWVVWKLNSPSSPEPQERPAAKAAAPQPYDKSEKAQAARKDLLDRSAKGGLVAKVTCRERGSDVWVNPMFEGITMDTKRGLVVTVHQWCFSGPDVGFVRIRSNQTDKELGMYSPDLGLDLK